MTGFHSEFLITQSSFNSQLGVASAVSCINTDLPLTVSRAPTSCPVLVLMKVIGQVVWGHENKAFFFSKQMCSKE